jgi:signal peptidase I
VSGGHCVVIRDEIITVTLSLSIDCWLDGSKVVSDVELAARLKSRQNTHARELRIFSEKQKTKTGWNGFHLARCVCPDHLSPVFTPRWKKEALLLLKASKKFLNYKRDLLAEDRIGEITSRQVDLRAAIKKKDRDAVNETSKQLRNACEKSLAHYRQPDWLAENIEVFWVAIVVALGIRAFFLQPFRIPTGSMQPSLNGIVATETHQQDGWEKPWFGQQGFDFLFKGRSYHNVVAQRDLTVKNMKDTSFFLFSSTTIFFTDGSKVKIGCPQNEAAGIETIRQIFAGGDPRRGLRPGPHFRKGDPIFQGYLTSGDLVLVDKVSYHFRDPKRGESFVFDTRGIDTQGVGKQAMSSQQGGTHYIKRCVGVPGDTIQIKEPDLYINGALAKEKTLQRVASQVKDSKGYPYTGYTNPPSGRGQTTQFSNEEYTITMQEPENNNYREFFALGDNSPNSLDSRFWGSVKQHNLVGPAFLALWPFTSGHWGLIK